ncbi:MAG TPA: ribosomal protein S18-alanine N-acetyltransferase [Clostridiales bacterium]|nr:ribosomal protein S18-alanine N-acetyltransferase [Clostridiales bacterium]
MKVIKPIPPSEEALNGLWVLEAASFSDPWSKESLANYLSNPLCRSAGVCIHGVWAAYGLLQAIAGEGEILRLAVLPSFRRKGLGEAVLSALMSEKDLSAVFLEVRAHNKAAISLYEKAGFVSCGLRPHYYQNPEEDALLMRSFR